MVDQIVQHLGLQALRPSGIEINLDGEGIVQDVKPKLTFRRVKAELFERPVAVSSLHACSFVHFDALERAYRCKCGKRASLDIPTTMTHT